MDEDFGEKLSNVHGGQNLFAETGLRNDFCQN